MSAAVPATQPSPAPNESRHDRWQRRTSGPLFGLALVYLLAWSFIVLDDDLSKEWKAGLFSLMILIWALFIVDYVVQIMLVSRRGRFILTHLLDLIAVIVPFLRPVVQLTHVTSVPYFQRRAGAPQRARILILAAAFVLVFVYSIALAVFNVERSARGANITTFGDAVWWACVTLFTVGYGDTYPVTALGRVFAVMLMLGGLTIIGVATAVTGSYLTERIQHGQRRNVDSEE